MRKRVREVYREALKARLKGLFKRPVYDSALFFAEKLGVDVEDLFKAVILAVDDPSIGGIAYDDALEALTKLKEHGYTIALLGNVMFWPGMITRLILHKNNLLKYVDTTLFGDELGVQKPDKRVFEELATKTSSRLEEIVHVGDSLVNDFAGALLAGVHAVLVKRSEKIPPVKIGEKAYVISDLRDLLKILEE